jgi:hypothetical protein
MSCGYLSVPFCCNGDAQVSVDLLEQGSLGSNGEKLAKGIKVTAQESVLLQGEFLHPIILQPADDDAVDWILENLDPAITTHDQQKGCRAITITLQKYCPIAGAVMWWRGVLQGDPEIDVTTIADRGTQGSKGLDSWREAQASFKAKIAEIKANRQEIDIS